MDSCDVLIVGAGPAGSSCARLLHDAGMDVLMVDKSDFPRDKTCAGWVTPEVVDILHIDLDDYRQNRVLQPITGFRSGVIGGGEVDTSYERVISYGIRRCEFDHYLLQRSGARCRLRERVARIERCEDHWMVNGRIRARMIVGAGGHFCPVARRLGARQNPHVSVVAAQEVEFRVGPTRACRIAVRPEVPEVFFCEDLKGYGWCFHKDGFVNVGLGRVDRHQLSSHVSRFCAFLTERGKVSGDVYQRFHGHAYQLYERVQPTLVADGVLLVGDAAGLAYPQSGEGIRPAVESGLIAADVILSTDGRYGRDQLDAYVGRILDRFGKPRGSGASRWLPVSWLRPVASRLLVSRWFARRIVMDRWFLHTQQPSLQLRHGRRLGDGS